MLLPMKISARHANEHAHLADHVGKTLIGHRIVVEGYYFAFEKGEKLKRKYREEFELAAHEHNIHGQSALGHLLSDKALGERLSKKDPAFRAIATHTIVEHGNLYEASAPPAPQGEPEDPEQEADEHADEHEASDAP